VLATEIPLAISSLLLNFILVSSYSSIKLALGTTEIPLAIPGIVLNRCPSIILLKYESGLAYHREKYTSLSARTVEEEKLAKVTAAIKALAVIELRCIPDQFL
jgi:hypothetical protein